MFLNRQWLIEKKKNPIFLLFDKRYNFWRNPRSEIEVGRESKTYSSSNMRRLWTASIPASVVIAAPEKARNFLGDMETDRSGDWGKRRNREEERDLKRIKERLNKEEADIDVLLHVVGNWCAPLLSPFCFILFYFMSTTLTMYLSAL